MQGGCGNIHCRSPRPSESIVERTVSEGPDAPGATSGRGRSATSGHHPARPGCWPGSGCRRADRTCGTLRARLDASRRQCCRQHAVPHEPAPSERDAQRLKNAEQNKRTAKDTYSDFIRRFWAPTVVSAADWPNELKSMSSGLSLSNTGGGTRG